MKKLFFNLLMVSLICLAALLVGCSKKGAESPPKKTKLAFITNGASDFWAFTRRGCEKADDELKDFEVDFRLVSDATSAEQRRIIDDLVVRGAKAIAISPIDPVNQKPMLDELCEKITVITCDSDIPGSKRLCYLGTDNVAAGRQAGEMIKEVLPEGGKIMIFVGKADTQNAKERTQGIKEAIAGSKVEIIDIRTDNNDKVVAKSNVADALVKYPDIACCVGLWNYNGPAILNAVTDADKLGKVKIVCFDEDEETLAGINDGYIYGTVVQQPYEFGYQSIKLLADIINGDESKIPPNKLIIIPTLIIKKDNVAEFTEKVNKLLGK
jgi:ribose transport system substrate-binding protein